MGLNEDDFLVPVVKFKLVNEGASPAFPIETAYKFIMLDTIDDVLPEVPDYGEPVKIDSMPIAASKPRWQHVEYENAIVEAQRVAVQKGESRLVFYGFVKYKDVFGKDCETRFCALWLWEQLAANPRFVYFGNPEYNKHT